jgi:uncharacterized protein (DUF2345 family)
MLIGDAQDEDLGLSLNVGKLIGAGALYATGQYAGAAQMGLSSIQQKKKGKPAAKQEAPPPAPAEKPWFSRPAVLLGGAAGLGLLGYLVLGRKTRSNPGRRRRRRRR